MPKSQSAEQAAQLLPERTRPQFRKLGRELGAVLDKLRPFGRGQIEHLHACAAQSDLLQQVLSLLDSPLCVDITFQVMAVTLESAGHHHAVGAVFKGVEHQQHVNLARAR